MSNLKSLVFYFIIVIAFLGVVNTAAYIQFSQVLKIEIHEIMFLIPSIIALLSSLLFTLVIHFNNKIKAMQMYEKIAKTDTLTGATSRYACELVLDIEMNRFKRQGTVFSIVMIDIDNFKRINDTYGHGVGDYVLCEMTEHLESALRDMDRVCRWGGEEFIVILPDTDSDEAKKVAEHLRERIDLHDFNETRHVTISLGVAAIKDKDKYIQTLIKRADDALYIAKRSGKNRVIVGSDDAGSGVDV